MFLAHRGPHLDLLRQLKPVRKHREGYQFVQAKKPDPKPAGDARQFVGQIRGMGGYGMAACGGNAAGRYLNA